MAKCFDFDTEGLTLNPVTLVFPEPLESEYREEYDNRMRRLTCMSLAVSMLVFMLFGIIDWLAGPDMRLTLLFYRYVVFAPVLLALTILTLIPALKKYSHMFISFWTLTLIIQVLSRASLFDGNVNTPFLASLIVVSIMAFAVYRLRFIWSLFTLVLGALLFFFFSLTWNSMSLSEYLYSTFFYMATIVIGIVSSYILEYFDRKAFYGFYITALEQKRIAEHNRRLELRIAEHSAQLKSTAEEMKREKEIRTLSVEALVSSEEKYRELFENSGDPIIVFDSGTSLIIDINKTGVDLFGYGEETVGQRFYTFFTDLYERDKLHEILNEKENVNSYEVKLANKCGEVLHCLLSITPRKNEKGEIVYYQAVVTDISERKKLEQQFIQAQKMESVGRLAGGVAHDFNNLLTALMGYSDFALMTLPVDDPSYGYFSEIKATSERAANLTRQLLTFSRRQIIEPKAILLTETLLNMDKMLRRLIGEDIELVTIPDENLWYVMMDSGQLEQVITNIVINARDAMPGGGKILIETGNITVEARNPGLFHGISAGDYASMKITDNGFGMSDETLSNIFEPFFTTKEEGKGTGLGLSTCYGIIEQNGGGIFVESEEGEGTIVTLLIPRSFERPAIEALKVTFDEIPGGAETILVVEDEATVRRMISRVLSRQGYNIIEADNGEEALRVMEKTGIHKISLVLTDVIMPRMGGKELSEQIAILAPGMKVLFMSGYTDESILTGGIIEEGLDFMKKPFSPADLLGKVRCLLDKA